KLVTNDAEEDGAGVLRLSMGYFEPTVNEIAGLGSDRVLATFQLRSLDVEGPVGIELEVETTTGQASRLELDGQAVAELTTGLASAGELVAGRATVMGTIALEGRQDMSAQVDFSLRRWGDYATFTDEVFAIANDGDPGKEGVQVPVQADGSFVLAEVPTGRWDLHAHLSGYLEAWIPGLELFPAQVVEGAQLASPGSGDRPRMLGGDVTGYLEVDGSSTQDNEVTLADWDFVAAFFGLDVIGGSAGERADITGDDKVNIQDLSLVGANFRRRGPVPVYKAVATGDQRVQWVGPAGAVAAGETVEFNIIGDGLTGMRAYELELEYDPAQWQWVGIDIATGRELMSAERRDNNHLRVGATILGRDGDLRDLATLFRWRLQARRDGAGMPVLHRAIFVDAEYRAIAAAIDHNVQSTPLAFALQQNYPNPFNPETAIDFAVPTGIGAVRLEIFDALGQRVAVLWNGALAPGAHRLHWRGLDQQGRPVASGIYIYRLLSGNRSVAKRMVLAR
ncbi:MAG: FlgD immunoglobulin-like domain containing protein, partial [Candidatus Latescibacterota bacterium]|nr:FlgD immunoglobulin-like domain containing protein [Candidatus Latescibacterota bacterium]